jgi:hypothetical protein
MKKFLFVLAIAAFVAACNDTSTESTSTGDSSMPATTDSATMAPVDTTMTAPMDTTKMMDSTKK